MDRYSYRPLDSNQSEIRLVDLLPGNQDDAISLGIRHASFVTKRNEVAYEIKHSMTLDELQKTLPPTWKAFETLENEYIFEHQVTEDTTWAHPGPALTGSEFRDQMRYGVTQSDLPDFEALSYTWGSQNEQHPITVLSATTETAAATTAFVGANLASALKHLRSSHEIRTLWIDSLCIDQSNLDERSQQVQRMADIYKSARRVVIWLGAEDRDSDHALDTLNTLGAQLELTIYGSKLRAPLALHKDWFRGSYSLPFDDRTWSALSCLLDRPWFRRLWVVQEFHLANNRSILQCGQKTIAKPLFRRALGCLNDKRQFPPGNMRELLNRVESLIFDISHEPLDMLIWTYTDRLCSDPRDKVYGLLGLANSELASKVHPNYEMPVNDVYKQVYLAILEHFGRLDHLRSMLEPSLDDDRPSWVLDLGAEIDHPRTTWQFCSGLSSAEVRYLPPNVLEAAGVRCATITEVLRACPRDDLATVHEVLKAWAPTEGDKPYVTGGSNMDAFASCLRYNLFQERMPMTALPTLDRWKSRVTNELLAKPYGAWMAKDLEIWYPLRNCRNKVFVNTQEGHFGICSVGVRTGDVICVLLGCSTPIVLRPVGGGYRVVGDCYLHGLNDATALLGPMPKQWRVILTRITAYSYCYEYVNSETGKKTVHDPRLQPLDSEWQHVPSKRTRDDPKVYEIFKNCVTGDIKKSDPRLTSGALLKRGINMEKFMLL